jgi:putative sigma-54 modulation protein
MEINIQFVKMPTSEHMEAFAIKKLKKLVKRYDWIMKANVFYKLEKDPKGKGKICDIQLSLPGPRIHASSNKEGFEFATDETIRDLEKQLKKRKAEMKPYR